MRKMIGTECECVGLHYLDLDYKIVICYSSVPAIDQRCWLGHPFLQGLKFLVPELSHAMSFDCESC